MSSTTNKVPIVIVGGGLSGLHTAFELQKSGIQYTLLEARHRLGGRIVSKLPDIADDRPEPAAFDLGPSWFWPHQQRINRLIQALGLSARVFEQTATGSSLYEDQHGSVHKDIANASMHGSLRLKGGIQRIINALVEHLPSHSYLTDSAVVAIHRQNQTLSVTYHHDNQIHDIHCEVVVLALPPRIAIDTIRFNPCLDPARIQQLKRIATWMAGQAKAAILYENDFWLSQGFSGDVISHCGPLQEIHDASSPGCEPFGLMGFVGQRIENNRPGTSELRIEIIDQLTRLFGPQAACPLDFYLKDWAFDPCTATRDDQQPILFHPSGQFTNAIETGWDNRLIWSGTETAGSDEHNFGYLEGALEASERTLDLLA